MTSLEGKLEAILDLENIHKSFGAVQALRGVDLTLHRGEVLGLVGDNGAGKSTLIGVIAGTLHPDAGRMIVDGREHLNDSPAAARRAGIETVFQSLFLIPALDISENIYLNRELFRLGSVGRWVRWMDKRRMRRETVAALEELTLRLPPPSTKVSMLSGGQRQAVAIARAIFWGSHILLMDEPTAALGVRQTEIVLGFIERLKTRRVGVIFVSHNIQQVLRVCDRIVVLHRGRKVLDTPREATNGNEVVAAITGVRMSDERDRVSGEDRRK